MAEVTQLVGSHLLTFPSSLSGHTVPGADLDDLEQALMTYMGRHLWISSSDMTGCWVRGADFLRPQEDTSTSEPSRCLSQEFGVGLRQALGWLDSNLDMAARVWSCPAGKRESRHSMEAHPPHHLLPQHLFPPPGHSYYPPCTSEPFLEICLVLFTQPRATGSGYWNKWRWMSKCWGEKASNYIRESSGEG